MHNYIGMLLENRYEILDVIGTGGMAVVYRARCRLLNRYVAIKILKDEFVNDADFRRRFHTESQAVAKLQHPNIVSVYDVNHSNNIEYIVMELVEGITLKEYMEKKGALSVSEFLHFSPQIARALEHAHKRGVIHRDIKPQNIIILRDGSLKVTDFGIARFAQSQQVTLTDEALGSVHYVSPEQAKGSNIDARSDLYSLGVVMYEMLTGCLPFEGDTPVAVVIQHINSIPLQPREINPEIPQPVEDIVMKAMAPLEGRYASATDILRDFERYQKDPDVDFGYSLAVMEPLVSDQTVKFEPVHDDAAAPPARPDSVNSSQRMPVPRKPAPPVRRNTEPMPQSAAQPRPAARPHPVARPHSVNGKPEPEPYIPRRRTSILVYLITGILTAAIFLGGAAFIITTIFSAAAGTDVENLKAPNLVGKKLGDVLSSTEYRDFQIVPSEYLYSETIPEGVIISQKPVGDRNIKPDTEIHVTVSQGRKKVALPDVSKMERRTAQLSLSSLGFLIREEYELSDTVSKDFVIRTDPAGPADLPEGTVVTLIVSLGKEETTTIVPNLIGRQENEAQRLLEKAGLILGEIIPQESTEEAGTIIGQSLDPDAEVPEKTAVDIFVSSLEANTEPDDPDDPGSGGTTPGGSSAVKGSFNMPIRLPADDRQTVRVTIQSGNEVLHDQTYETKIGMIYITLRGTGSILAQVYFDNVFYADQVIVFD